MTIKQEANLQEMIMLNKGTNQDKIMDQYKVLIESVNKSNELRESANNFWVTVHSLGISSIAYIRDASNVESNQKPFII